MNKKSTFKEICKSFLLIAGSYKAKNQTFWSFRSKSKHFRQKTNLGKYFQKVLISVRGLIKQTYLAALLPCLVNWYLGGPEKTRADTALTHGLPNPK